MRRINLSIFVKRKRISTLETKNLILPQKIKVAGEAVGEDFTAPTRIARKHLLSHSKNTEIQSRQSAGWEELGYATTQVAIMPLCTFFRFKRFR